MSDRELTEKAKVFLDANIWGGEDRSGCKDRASFNPDELQELFNDFTKELDMTKHKEEIETQYNNLKGEHDKEIDLLDDAYRAEVEQAREETRQQCADICFNADKSTHPADLGELILNLGKQDKGGKV